MALKAGLVGVNPKGVDKNGMPIGSAGNAVDEAQLTANGKQFHFAYDETSEKYGYKLDGVGDFIPFESAGGGPGWVKPAELTSEGVTAAYGTLEDGGFYVKDDVCYVDLLFKASGASSSARAVTIPIAAGEGTFSFCKINGDTDTVFNTYIGAMQDASSTKTDGKVQITAAASANQYCHIWGMYNIATA